MTDLVDIIENGKPVKTVHCCQMCGAILAICSDHRDYQDVKRCEESLRILCDDCAK